MHTKFIPLSIPYYRFSYRSRNLLFLPILLVLASLNVSAQTKQIQSIQQSWFSIQDQSRLTSKWGIWNDLQIKTKDNYTNNFSSSEFSLGAIYVLPKNLKLVGAYTYVTNYPSEARTINVYEHRPWQMIQMNTNLHAAKWMQWLRLEERFKSKTIDNNTIGDGYDFSYRIRYNVFTQLALGKHKFAPGTFSLAFGNEIFINFGEHILYNTFDQNRIFMGTFYHVNKHDNLQIGYSKVYQQLASGNKYKSLDVFKVTYLSNLDFTRK